MWNFGGHSGPGAGFSALLRCPLYSSIAVPENCDRPGQSAYHHNLSPFSGLHHNLGLDWTRVNNLM
jgi:hypothetical protein